MNTERFIGTSVDVLCRMTVICGQMLQLPNQTEPSKSMLQLPDEHLLAVINQDPRLVRCSEAIRTKALAIRCTGIGSQDSRHHAASRRTAFRGGSKTLIRSCSLGFRTVPHCGPRKCSHDPEHDLRRGTMIVWCHGPRINLKYS